MGSEAKSRTGPPATYPVSVTFSDEELWIGQVDQVAQAAGGLARAVVLRECIRRALPGIAADVASGRFDDDGPEGVHWRAR